MVFCLLQGLVMKITFLVVVCLLQGARNQDYVGIDILFIARG